MNASPLDVKIERLAQSRVQATVTFPPAAVAEAEARALNNLGGNVKMDGFRPGHAPAEEVKKRVNSDQLLEETIRELLPAHLPTIVEEHKILSIIPPRVEALADSPLQIRLTFVEKPPVSLKGADKISVPKKVVAVEEKDVDSVLQAMRDQFRTTQEIDRPATAGDQLTIDFTAEDAEKQPVPELNATEYQVILGSNTLLPGMEDGMLGLRTGETRAVIVKIPEKHQLERLRGQSISFNVTVKKAESVQRPEMTDAFASEKFQIPTVAALRSEVKGTLEREEENGDRTRRERELLDGLRKATQVDLAPELIEAEERVMLEDLRARLEEEGQSFSDWVKQSGKNNEEIAKDLKARATDRLTLRFGLEKLIEDKRVTVTEEEVDAAVRTQLQQFPDDQRIEAAGIFTKGSDAWLQLEWQRRVEKALQSYLS